MGRRVGRLALCVLLLAAGLALVRTVASPTGPSSADGVVLSVGPAASATVAPPLQVAATLPPLTALLALAMAGLAIMVTRRPSLPAWQPAALGRAPPDLPR